MKPYIKPLPADLTTYDFLKFLAVFTMIIDHIGVFFFPEQNEWRAIGRMSMPIWLFLVGFANTREMPPILWGGAFILLGSYLVLGNSLLPLNILFTIIITRAIIDQLATMTFKNTEGFLLGMVAMFFLAIPMTALFDYGTLAFLWALFGYILRHQVELKLSDTKIIGFGALTWLIYLVYQYLFFGFNTTEAIIMIIGVSISTIILYRFKPQVLPNITNKTPVIIRNLVQFSGRKTLYIYVVHLIVFLGIAFFLFPEEYGFFNLKFYD